ncbi:MAG: trehalose-phosphatase [Actinobacteria bacterium]|nr:trehalose-phosphatase [Actinomycetota bacterium]
MTRPDPFAVLRENPTRSAILTDFDGSLARIVDDPPLARPVAAAGEVLERLVQSFGLVAVVSGRPVSFLREVLTADGVVLVGQYGMERLVDGEVVVEDAVRPWLGVAALAADALEAALPGLYVERKGEVACVVHWRPAPEREAEARTAAAAVAEERGLVLLEARMAVELRPPVAIDKGTAVAALVRGFDAALFGGDDRGDLDAYDALDRLVDEGALGVAVRVAVASPEAPPELLARADERVSSPDEFVRALGGLTQPP